MGVVHYLSLPLELTYMGSARSHVGQLNIGKLLGLEENHSIIVPKTNGFRQDF